MFYSIHAAVMRRCDDVVAAAWYYLGTKRSSLLWGITVSYVVVNIVDNLLRRVATLPLVLLNCFIVVGYQRLTSGLFRETKAEDKGNGKILQQRESLMIIGLHTMVIGGLLLFCFFNISAFHSWLRLIADILWAMIFFFAYSLHPMGPRKVYKRKSSPMIFGLPAAA